ncbi:hypothetical protein EDD15DRAFT_2360070 [Pisolithus albus]|nr:hypothetical protein EDD15DRAFT_2360070 [Pisolithus albus]
MSFLRPVLSSRPLPLACGRRALSSTSSIRRNDQHDVYRSFGHTSIFRRIADKPEALTALRDFAALLKDKGSVPTAVLSASFCMPDSIPCQAGIDPTAGPPSVTQMLRLAASSDFRLAAQRVVTELRRAGVDLKSQDVVQELIASSKKPENC